MGLLESPATALDREAAPAGGLRFGVSVYPEAKIDQQAQFDFTLQSGKGRKYFEGKASTDHSGRLHGCFDIVFKTVHSPGDDPLNCVRDLVLRSFLIQLIAVIFL